MGDSATDQTFPRRDPTAIDAPSPNFGPRRDGVRPSLVILHYTAMSDAAAALARLRDPAAEVSAHYLIDESGALYALVDESARAWHAGVSSWRGESDVNSLSIGIELAHPGHDAEGRCAPFPEPQMRRLEMLLSGIRERWKIAPESVLAHSDVAPGRKIDPGERFDWRRLDRLGLAISAPDLPVAPSQSASFWDDLRAIGIGDWPKDALLDAFRRRFRPATRPSDPLSEEDAAIAASLLRRFAGPRDSQGGAGYG